MGGISDAGRLQSGEQRVHHGLALAAIQRGEPAIQRLGATLRALGKLGERGEGPWCLAHPVCIPHLARIARTFCIAWPRRPIRAFHDPVEHRVLLEAAARGLHHVCRHRRFHEDAHHGIGRHLLGHAARKRRVVGRREQTGLESGAVVVVQVSNAALHLRRRRERRVLGQVAALGMAAQNEGLGQSRISGHRRQIAGRQRLGLDRRLIGHVEVLAPPGERRVGAAKAHVSEVPGAHVGRGGELQIACLVERSCMIVDEQITKARAGGHPEQLLLHLRRVHAGEHRREQLGPHKVGEPHGIHGGLRILRHFRPIALGCRRRLRSTLARMPAQPPEQTAQLA